MIYVSLYLGEYGSTCCGAVKSSATPLPSCQKRPPPHISTPPSSSMAPAEHWKKVKKIRDELPLKGTCATYRKSIAHIVGIATIRRNADESHRLRFRDSHTTFDNAHFKHGLPFFNHFVIQLHPKSCSTDAILYTLNAAAC